MNDVRPSLHTQQSAAHRPKDGFTLVELVIVIVVIGILAAIILVSYSTVTKQADTSSLSSNLTRNYSILTLANKQNGSYPSSQSAAGLKADTNVTLTYTPGPANTFCLQASGYGLTQYITDSNNIPTSGNCPASLPLPLAAWNFNEGTGTSSADQTGNGHTANFVNGTWTGGGHVSDGLTGGPNAAKAVGFSTSDNHSMSLTGWFYVPSSMSANSMIITADATSSTFSGIAVGTDGTVSGAYNFNAVATSSPGVASTSGWYYFASTFDSSTRALTVYVNGSQTGTATIPGTDTYPGISDIEMIGNDGGYYSSGLRADDVRVFDVALTQSQINSYMNSSP